MSDPINVTIGGEEIPVPLIMVFETLERAWPAIKALSEATDPIEGAAAEIAILSHAVIATRPDLTIPKIKSRLRIGHAAGADERQGLSAAIQQILVKSGLVRMGEASPPETPAEATA